MLGFVFVVEAFRLTFLFARMISLFVGRRGAVPYDKVYANIITTL